MKLTIPQKLPPIIERVFIFPGIKIIAHQPPNNKEWCKYNIGPRYGPSCAKIWKKLINKINCKKKPIVSIEPE